MSRGYGDRKGNRYSSWKDRHGPHRYDNGQARDVYDTYHHNRVDYNQNRDYNQGFYKPGNSHVNSSNEPARSGAPKSESVSTSAVKEQAALSEKLKLQQERWIKEDSQTFSKQNTNANTGGNGKSEVAINTASTSVENGILSKDKEADESPEEKKKRLRREKLEAWKRKREAEKQAQGSQLPSNQRTSSVSVEPPAKKAKLSTSKRTLKTRKIVVKSVFGEEYDDDDDEQVKPVVAKRILQPSTDINNINIAKNAPNDKESSNEADPLDEFFANIESNDAPMAKQGETLIDDEDLELGNLDSDDNEGQENVEDIVKKMESSKKTQQKNIEKVNHDEVYYEDFRKKFYVESQEVGDLTKEEVEVLRLELDGIKVHGTNPPNPVSHWSQLGLPASYLDVLLNNLKFEKPTPIQAQSIPAVLQGRDVIGIAKTGSGKSLSYILPLFRHIKDRKDPRKKDPLALILVPTRELTMQTYSFATKINSTLKSVPVFGGENISKQINQLGSGVDLVIATPGRLIDLLSLKKIKLLRITFLVIDEADRMFDMGFQPQINMIIDNIRPDCQKVLFSATFPMKLEKLARKILNTDPLEIKIGLKGVNDDVRQVIHVFEKDEDKFVKLLEILGEFFNNGKILEDIRNSSDIIGEDKVLIFVDRQESADILAKRLINRGYECEALHGGKSQVERDTIINNFKKSKNKIMIATSIAARGLDVQQLKLVINYDCPNHIEDYVHRAGRTGRAGSKGIAISFLVKDQERASYDIVKALKLSNVSVPEELEAISNKFLQKIKSGKERVFAGFGGKGLEKFEAKRDENKKLITQRLGADIDDNAAGDTGAVKTSPDDKIDNQHSKAIGDKLSELSDFEVHEGKATNSPDAGAYHSKINVNDLPQDVRWKVTNRETIAKIIEETACALTSKGKFYKGLDKPLKPTDEPKLYLLVEGDSHSQVAAAVSMVKDYIVEGMKIHLADESKKVTTGRYSVT